MREEILAATSSPLQYPASSGSSHGMPVQHHQSHSQQLPNHGIQQNYQYQTQQQQQQQAQQQQHVQQQQQQAQQQQYFPQLPPTHQLIHLPPQMPQMHQKPKKTKQKHLPNVQLPPITTQAPHNYHPEPSLKNKQQDSIPDLTVESISSSSSSAQPQPSRPQQQTGKSSVNADLEKERNHVKELQYLTTTVFHIVRDDIQLRQENPDLVDVVKN